MFTKTLLSVCEDQGGSWQVSLIEVKNLSTIWPGCSFKTLLSSNSTCSMPEFHENFSPRTRV